MKRHLALFLCLILLFTLCACGTGPNPTETTVPTTATEAFTTPTEPKPAVPSSPILYRATDSQGNAVYLFGSIHIGIDSMYPLPDYVMNAYAESDTLAVEFDVLTATEDATASAQALSRMVLTDGKIRDHIPGELYDAAVAILKENHSYISLMDMYMPILWYSMIDGFTLANAGLDDTEGIDVHLLELAHKEGKPIEDIESMESQYDMLAGMSMELQTILLENAVINYNNPLTRLQYRQMCKIWANGNEDALISMIQAEDDQLPPEQLPLYEEYNEALSGKRNPVMAQYARDAMASGKTVFICVGAAHIVGPGALVEILTQDGYTLERILE